MTTHVSEETFLSYLVVQQMVFGSRFVDLQYTFYLFHNYCQQLCYHSTLKVMRSIWVVLVFWQLHVVNWNILSSEYSCNTWEQVIQPDFCSWCSSGFTCNKVQCTRLSKARTLEQEESSGKILLCGYSFNYISGTASIKKVSQTAKSLGAVGFVVAVENSYPGTKFDPVPVSIPGILITDVSKTKVLSFKGSLLLCIDI